MLIKRNKVDFLEWRLGKGETAELFDIAVMSNRQIGIGKEMVKEFEGKCKKKGIVHIYAFVRMENAVAREFYKHMGFKEVFLEDFYPDGHAMIVMKKI
jgi:ribosomal protein S18 acetylase RimI-like enzyme